MVNYIPELKRVYNENVVSSTMKEFAYKSVMQVPKIEKIVLSMGVGEAIRNKKLLDSAVYELSQISSQKALKTKAKKAIAGFKIREGQEIGAKVTLRGNLMWDFLFKLINLSLPRVKDFRGLNPNSFDKKGNYSFGITEQIIFPEIDYDKIEKITGLNITIVTTANNNREALFLLKALGMPFRS